MNKVMLSELIRDLSKIMEEHGDLPVYTRNRRGEETPNGPGMWPAGPAFPYTAVGSDPDEDNLPTHVFIH